MEFRILIPGIPPPEKSQKECGLTFTSLLETISRFTIKISSIRTKILLLCFEVKMLIVAVIKLNGENLYKTCFINYFISVPHS